MDATDGASLPQSGTGRGTIAMIHAVTRLIRLDAGLFALGIGPVGGAHPYSASGITLPCIQVTSPPSSEFDAVEIFGAWNDNGAWLGAEGGTVVLRVPPGGGQVLATLFTGPGFSTTELDDVSILRLDQLHTSVLRTPDVPVAGGSSFEEAQLPAPFADVDDFLPDAVAEAVPEPPAAGEAELEIALHMERLGDMMFPGNVWCGKIGDRLQIEAFGIRGTGADGPLPLEYMAYGPAGRQTRWVTDGQICGSRGRGIPLTGFAVRLAPGVADAYEVTYQGSFFGSGATLPFQNGAPCLPPGQEEFLEAIHVRVKRRDR